MRRRYEVWRSAQAITLVPRGGASGAQLVYVHGGAYAHPLGRMRWSIIDRIPRGMGTTVTVPV